MADQKCNDYVSVVVINDLPTGGLYIWICFKVYDTSTSENIIVSCKILKIYIPALNKSLKNSPSIEILES